MAAIDPVGGTWVYSSAVDRDTGAITNGFVTYVNYMAYSMCLNDGPLSNYHVNEQFAGSFVPAYDGENWPSSPTAGSIYLGPGFTQWADKIGFWDPGSAPGDPAYCYVDPFALCVPPFSNPGVGPHTLVDHIPQSWFIGSPISGSGVRVQMNTLQRYTDSGWHTDIVTPNP